MRTPACLCAGSLIGFLAVLCPLQAVELRVAADKVNLRAAPNSQAEVVAQVAKGDTLRSTDTLEGEWIQVVPPNSVSFYVYAELIRDGLAATKTLMRAGPGINYKPIGKLEEGDKVTTRGTSGEWIKIAPAEGTFVWVNRKFVETVAYRSPMPAETHAPPIQTEQPITSPSRPSPSPPQRHSVVTSAQATATTEAVAIEDREGLPEEGKFTPPKGQGKQVEYEGVLGTAGFVFHRPSRYRLVAKDHRGDMTAACYVLGKDALLKSLTGKTLLISGREYWISGVKYPAVLPEQIIVKD